MKASTPASRSELPPLGILVADEPLQLYRSATFADEEFAHLRVWTTVGSEPGHLAVVTETCAGASVTESADLIWAELGRLYGPSVVLLEHAAPEVGKGMETLHLVCFAADDNPIRTRIWPGSEDSPRHSEFELWMATDGYRIVSKAASWFDFCEDEDLARDRPCHSPGNRHAGPDTRPKTSNYATIPWAVAACGGALALAGCALSAWRMALCARNAMIAASSAVIGVRMIGEAVAVGSFAGGLAGGFVLLVAVWFGC
jgi:hypothetical protein